MMTTGLVADFARMEVCLCIIQLPRKRHTSGLVNMVIA
jgi:hypothetical protein